MVENYKEIEGNLITLAKEGKFDVIGHGCNCFCTMKRGIAPQMAEAFGCNKYNLEHDKYKGDINKLGQIDYKGYALSDGANTLTGDIDNIEALIDADVRFLTVVNCYTQYQWSTETRPFDYTAFTLCMRKMNYIFKGKHIGLPQIGSHLAGGDWNVIKEIIKQELIDCKITIVIFNGKL